MTRIETSPVEQTLRADREPQPISTHRVGVFNRYWSTGGGGERYAASMAIALSRAQGFGPVELLGPEVIDVAGLESRLHLDLDGVRTRLIGPSVGDVTAASGDYDVFINASHLSAAPSRAANSFYVVYFPVRPKPTFGRWRSRLASGFDGFLDGTDVQTLTGIHPPDALRRHVVRWTDGDYRFMVPAGSEVVHVTLGRYLPRHLGSVDVDFEIEGSAVHRTRLTPVRSRWDRRRTAVASFPVPTRNRPVEVAVRSRSHVPAEVSGNADTRSLGVPILSVRAGRGLRPNVAAHLPLLGSTRPRPGVMTGYHPITISNYVRDWTREYWQCESTVLHPPAAAHAPGDKEPEILSVGRFIRPGDGHCKRQLELVEAFGRLCAEGLKGWQLHLLGGASGAGLDYADTVRRAAHGLPVTIQLNADGDEVAKRYRSASIYWHATGLGEDPLTAPEVFEHFGISVVEAMGAGAVPVVMGRGGPSEIVTDGGDGHHFTTIDELVTHTRTLVDDPTRLAELAERAKARAANFSDETFAARTVDLVTDLIART